eukprot:12382399-Alexandrium_andersonii.AAC.1
MAIGLLFPAAHRPFGQKVAGEPLQGASPRGLPPPPSPSRLAPPARAVSLGGLPPPRTPPKKR